MTEVALKYIMMKIMTNSIKKGKKFEREIAKRLSKLTGKEFLRVPMSGGFSTSFKTRTLKGDVFSEAEDYKDVVVECKIRKNPIKILKKLNAKQIEDTYYILLKKRIFCFQKYLIGTNPSCENNGECSLDKEDYSYSKCDEVFINSLNKYLGDVNKLVPS